MAHRERDRLQLVRRESLPMTIAGPAITWIADKLERKAGRRLPDDDFYEKLNNFLPPFRCGHQTPRKRLRDAEVRKITTLLQQWGKADWSLLPKTFAVLRAIGLEHHMDAFILDGRSDICLPYTHQTLPDALTGEARAKFLDWQVNVLTGSGAKLESGKSKHLNLRYDALDRLFLYQGQLGKGGFGEVHHVIGKDSLQEFALKTISRQHFDDSEERRSLYVFQNELNALQALSHKHIVKLVGSYTDPTCIGLLMQPVADEDLSTFMKRELSPQAQNDRRLRIRSFFGCLARAMDYLHNNETNRVQHKDINPRNILVKGPYVYVADFGTARLKSDGSSETTEPTLGGTFRMLTRQYAPAEAFGGTRTYASDIWSLGCVYLEMATLLSRRNLKDLGVHLRSNGTGLLNYWENPTAIVSWIDSLRDDFKTNDSPMDAQLIDIVQAMCRPDRAQRLTASDLVRRIYKLDAAFHGTCCSRRVQVDPELNIGRCKAISDPSIEFDDDDDSDTSSNDSSDTTDSDSTIGPLDSHPNGNLVDSTANWRTFEQGHDLHYASPIVEDAETTIVLRNVPPKQTSHVLEDVTEFWRPPQGVVDTKKQIVPPADASIPDVQNLPRGPRADDHGKPTPSVDDTVNDAKMGQSHAPAQPKTPHSPSAFTCLWPTCQLRTEAEALVYLDANQLTNHLQDAHHVHDFGKSILLDGSRSFRERTATLDGKSGALQLLRPNGSKKVSFTKAPHNSQSKFDNISVPKLATDPDLALVKRKNARQQSSHETGTMPAASPAPSLLLASKNKSSKSELESRQAMFGRPLFVYGSLMPPSVLHSRSKAFTEVEGTYSSEQGRRLRTTSRDWNGADKSIRAAADSLRPASLRGYGRFSDVNRFHAEAHALCDSAKESHLDGMIVLGLSEEALACLDHLFEKAGPMHLFNEQTRPRADERLSTEFERRNITVSVSLANGESMEVDAQAYISQPEANSGGRERWDLDRFLRSRSFNKLTNGLENGAGILEEDEIAQSLGTRLMLPGDDFVEAVLQGDRDKIKTLLSERVVDVNGLSARYGTALQAAASKGDLSTMESLLEAGASVDIVGGQYRTALIAAVVEGHYRGVKLLLRHNAKVFAPAGQYVSALYQAIDYDRLDIAHALLEKGAWLTQDFGELLDLADEHDDDEMWDELVRYDVRGVHRKRRKQRPTRDVSRKEPDETAIDSINKTAGFVCLWEAVKLHNQPGKWTGIKGVRVLRAGIEHGLPETVLESIRPHVHSFPTIQKFFVDAVGESFGGRLLPVQHSDPRPGQKRRGEGADDFALEGIAGALLGGGGRDGRDGRKVKEVKEGKEVKEVKEGKEGRWRTRR